MSIMSTRSAIIALVATLLFANSARAELLRVEIKTLGMD
jgi:hypothetical protein